MKWKSLANKLNDLEAYDKVKDEVDHHQARMDREEIEIEDFHGHCFRSPQI